MLNRDDFKAKRLMDTGITSFSDLADARDVGASVVAKNNQDKGITTRKIAGKALIEKQCLKTRVEKFRNDVFDAVDTRSEEFKSIAFDKLLSIAQKLIPQQVDQRVEHKFTFADFVARTTENVIDVDAEVVDES